LAYALELICIKASWPIEQFQIGLTCPQEILIYWFY